MEEKLEFIRLALEESDLLFLNRIYLKDDDVYRFLHSVLPPYDNIHNVYKIKDKYALSFTSKKGKFVKLRGRKETDIHWDIIGRKGFIFEASLYVKNQAHSEKIGNYLVFYQPYSLECIILRKKTVFCKILNNRFLFGEKPIVKYIFNVGGERIKRYFHVKRRAIRAYKELLLGPMPKNSL